MTDPATYHCPVCNSRHAAFKPYGVSPRPDAQCPTCGSLERHRLLWLYLKNRTDLFTEPTRLLHFAPESCTRDAFRAATNIDYVTSDFIMRDVDIRADIQNLPLPDADFDAIICIHVLEHVPNDHQALRELFRILRPGGWAIILVPMSRSLAVTDEDISITDPQERIRRFHHPEHVRLYGADYPERLTAAGFGVTVHAYRSELGPETVRNHALWLDEDLYVCRKPA